MDTSASMAPLAEASRLTRERSEAETNSRLHSSSRTRSSQTRTPTSSTTQIRISLMVSGSLPAQAMFQRFGSFSGVDDHIAPLRAAVLVLLTKIFRRFRKLPHGADQPGGNHHDELALFVGNAIRAEQCAQDRDVTQPRQTVAVIEGAAANQATDDKALTRRHGDHGFGSANPKPGDRDSAGGYAGGEIKVAHFRRDFQDDLVFVYHGGRQRQADTEFLVFDFHLAVITGDRHRELTTRQEGCVLAAQVDQ